MGDLEYIMVAGAGPVAGVLIMAAAIVFLTYEKTIRTLNETGH